MDLGLPKDPCLQETGFFLFPFAISRDHEAKGFLSFCDFEALQGNSVAKVMSHSDVSRSVGNSAASPRTALPLRVHQTPMALRRDKGAARGAKAAFPVVE